MFTKSTIVALFLGQISARVAISQAQKNDIGEKGIDEEVHGFASNDTNVLPQPWRRRNEAYPNNGILNGWTKGQVVAQSHHKHHHGKKIADIGEKKMDEEVHGFAAADTNVLPVQYRRRNESYPNNGILNGWTKGQVVAQQEPGINEPYAPNGVRNPWPKSLAQEAALLSTEQDEPQSSFTQELPKVVGVDLPYQNNGVLNNWPQAIHQTGTHDIANKNIRVDVYETVERMVDPVAQRKTSDAP